MDDSTEHPKLLANRVIQQMVDHMLADAPRLEAKDFMVIRTVFRSAAGDWASLTNGDTAALALLKSIVTAWGGLRGPAKQKDFI